MSAHRNLIKTVVHGFRPVRFRHKRMPSERALQEEQNGAISASQALSSVEFRQFPSL